jgi:hypothetical protein
MGPGKWSLLSSQKIQLVSYGGAICFCLDTMLERAFPDSIALLSR